MIRADPGRMVRDLRELAELTSTGGGAQRVAWTEPWDRARQWLVSKLEAIGTELETNKDGADNLWTEFSSRPEGPLIAIGSHLDSVPDGGWLDGCLGVVAGLELLRSSVEAGQPAGLRLIDWADEEGRFGNSLLGSTAATGGLDFELLPSLCDRDGITLEAVAERRGLDLSGAADGGPLVGVDGYFELHIEQGPVLEDLDLSLGVPSGSVAIDRSRLVFEGAAAHAGTTPFQLRRDAGLAAARVALATREIAIESAGLATVGSFVTEPGVPTAVPSRATLILDLRHRDDAALGEMSERIGARARHIAGEERVELRVEPVWSFPAVAFDPNLIRIAREAVPDTAEMFSGALHDAVAVARSGVPTAMIFVRSRGGVSHSPLEDSDERDLADGLTALAESVDRARGA